MKLLRTTDTPESSFEDRGEVRVVLASAAAGPASGAIGVLRCKNYGCQVEFDVRPRPISPSSPPRPPTSTQPAPRCASKEHPASPCPASARTHWGMVGGANSN